MKATDFQKFARYFNSLKAHIISPTKEDYRIFKFGTYPLPKNRKLITGIDFKENTLRVKDNFYTNFLRAAFNRGRKDQS